MFRELAVYSHHALTAFNNKWLQISKADNIACNYKKKWNLIQNRQAVRKCLQESYDEKDVKTKGAANKCLHVMVG